MGSDPVMLHWSDTIRCRNSGAMYQILAALEGLPEVALLTVPPGNSSPPDQHESNEVWISRGRLRRLGWRRQGVHIGTGG